MEKKYFSLFTLFLSFCLITSTGEYVNATAIADCEFKVFWNTLTIKDSSGGTLSPSIDWYYRGLQSEAWINGPDTSNPGYVQSISPDVTTTVTHSLGANTATLSSDLVSPYTTLSNHTISSSSGTGDKSGWINGNIHRGIMYDLSTLSGQYTFSVDYSFTASLSREDAQEGASNYSQLTFYLEDNVNTPSARIGISPIVFSPNFVGNDLSHYFSESGTASFDITLPQTEWTSNTLGHHWLEAHVHTSTSTYSNYVSTPVPIPPAAWLLGSGLLGLVAIRRRMRNRITLSP